MGRLPLQFLEPDICRTIKPFHPTSVAIFTFSKTLVKYLDHLVADRPSTETFDHTIKDLTVVNFHSWAWGFMAEKGALKAVEVAKEGVQMTFVQKF